MQKDLSRTQQYFVLEVSADGVSQFAVHCPSLLPSLQVRLVRSSPGPLSECDA